MSPSLSEPKHLTDLRRTGAIERSKQIERLLSKWQANYGAPRRPAQTPPDLQRISGIVHDWTGLLEVARLYTDEGGGNWIFRGQTFPHSLTPKIGRKDARKDPSKNSPLPHSPQDEKWIFDEFKRRARPYLTHSPQEDLEWLAIAQHHGMPTRLLDWTEGFLAAAYFAVEKTGVDGPAIIYASPGEDELPPNADPFAIRRIGFYRPPHITARIPAQQGVFTVHPNPAVTYAPQRLEQWVIEKNACYNIKKQLHLCGMNAAVLFPDIDGLGKYLEWLYKRPTSAKRVGRAE